MAATWKAPDGTPVELPKLTLELSEATDSVRAASSSRDRYGLEWSFLSRVLPADVLADAADGDSLEDCDVVALECAYQSVVRAYTAPMVEERNREIREQVALLRPVSEAAQSVAALSDPAARRAQRRVR